MQAFEFRFLDWINGENETLIKLDELGKEGWRVSAVTMWDKSPWFVLERPLPEKK
jgi:hypothetical protein